MRDRILCIVSLAGPAEALCSVLSALKNKADTKVFGLKKGNTRFPGVGGSYEVFNECLDQVEEVHERDIVGVLDEYKPSIVLLGSVPDLEGELEFPEKEVVRLAHQKGIRSIQFIDSWMAFSTSALCPDVFFVIDDLSKQLCQKVYPHLSDHQIKVVGHPGLEAFAKNNVGFKKRMDDRLAVCYFTQVNVNTAEVLHWLSGALQEGDILYIKNHPQDRIDYNNWKDRFGCRYEVTNLSPEQIYEKINVCLTHTSVVGIKSAILGIPTINIKPKEHMKKFYDLLNGYPLSIMGLSREVNNEREFQQALKNKMIPKASIHFKLEGAISHFVNVISPKE